MNAAKVVRFGEISERFIPDLNMSEEERDSLWFNRKQMRKFRRQAERDETDDVGRISVSRFNQRRNYIRYVLRIQEYNKSVGIEDDATGLAAVAVALSKSAMENARFRAGKDASEVLAAYEREQEQENRQKDLFTTETESDAKHPGYETKRSHVSINVPKRNRTAANMA